MRREISLAQRFRILRRDHFCCMYCGQRSPFVSLQVDHFVPVAAGGQNDDRNLITACRECNAGKTDTMYDWGKPNGQRYEPRSRCSCARPTCGGPKKARDDLERGCRCWGCHGCDLCGGLECERAAHDEPFKTFGNPGECEFPGMTLGGCFTTEACVRSPANLEWNLKQIRSDLRALVEQVAREMHEARLHAGNQRS